MEGGWPVWEIGFRENWKCASVETSKVPKPEEPKWWGMMTSLGADVDPRISKVTLFEYITGDEVDTWYVCHLLVSFEHADD
jgi:hypothetical protein